MNSTEQAAKSLDDFAQGSAQQSAEDIAKYFELAGDRMAMALANAAKSGELSMRDMVSSIAQDLARLAIQDLLIKPLEGALGLGGGAGSNLQDTLNQNSNPVNVVMNISGVNDANGFQKSQGQISASLARAVAQGRKYT